MINGEISSQFVVFFFSRRSLVSHQSQLSGCRLRRRRSRSRVDACIGWTRQGEGNLNEKWVGPNVPMLKQIDIDRRLIRLEKFDLSPSPVIGEACFSIYVDDPLAWLWRSVLSRRRTLLSLLRLASINCTQSVRLRKSTSHLLMRFSSQPLKQRSTISLCNLIYKSSAHT